MSEVGLGRVKTQRCCDDIEWVFRQATFLIVQASWACSVAIDFGKLFSSAFNFSSFYTAWTQSEHRRLPVKKPDRPNRGEGFFREVRRSSVSPSILLARPTKLSALVPLMMRSLASSVLC